VVEGLPGWHSFWFVAVTRDSLGSGRWNETPHVACCWPLRSFANPPNSSVLFPGFRCYYSLSFTSPAVQASSRESLGVLTAGPALR
jgi:hypothetical protein